MKVRDVTGHEAVDLMQRLTERIWSPASRFHIGDLAWERFHISGREETWRTRVWEEGGRIVAWGWLELPAELSLQVDPTRPDMADVVLGWFEEQAEAPPLEVTVLDGEVHLVKALLRRGYTARTDGPFFLLNVLHLDDLPEPAPPAGFTFRPIDPAADLGRRVEQHASAWAPSRVSEESYAALMRQFPYRSDLDWVAEAADGTFVSECLIWFDRANGVGEIEPTSTRHAFRRLGLGRATCLFALHHLKGIGATTAVVSCRGDAAYPVPKALYHGMGFRAEGTTVTYVRHA